MRASAILSAVTLISNITGQPKLHALTDNSARKHATDNALKNADWHYNNSRVAKAFKEHKSADFDKENTKTSDNVTPTDEKNENITGNIKADNLKKNSDNEVNPPEKIKGISSLFASQAQDNITAQNNQKTGIIDMIASAGNFIDRTINKYDPLTFPTTNASPVTNNRPEKTSLNNISKIQNNEINNFLKNESILISSYKNSIPLLKTLNGVAEFLDKKPHKSDEIARAILQQSGNTDSPKNAFISDSESDFIINRWLSEQILKTNPTDFLAQKIAETAFPEEYTLAHLKDFLSLDARLPNDNKQPVSPMLKELWNDAIEQAFPLFAVDNAEHIPLKDNKWGFKHAGALYLKQSGVEDQDITLESASFAGKMIFTLMEENALPDAINGADLFRLPALVEYAIHNPADWKNNDAESLMNTRKEAIKNLFSHYRQHIKNNVFDHFNEAMAVWKPRLEVVENYKRLAQPWYLAQAAYASENNRGDFDNIPIDYTDYEAADAEYKEKTEHVAEKYADIDRILVNVALGEADEADLKFIADAQVKHVDIEISDVETARNQMRPMSPQELLSKTSSLKPGVSVFSAVKGGKEKIYALKPEEAGYSLQLLNRDKDDYYWKDLMADNQGLNNPNYKLNVIPRDTHKNQADGMEVLLNSLVKEHKDHFYKSLYDQGYEKLFSEKVRDFFLSLIPFYDCTQSIRSGDVAGATISCSLDILSFIPVVGKIASMSGKFAGSVAMGVKQIARTAMTTATRDAIQSGVFRQAVKDVGKNTLRNIAIPGTRQLSAVGVEAIRAVDPGFEMLWNAGKVSKKLLMAIAKKIENKAPVSFEKIINKLNTKEKQLENIRKIRYKKNEIDTEINIKNEIKNKKIEPGTYKNDGTTLDEINVKKGSKVNENLLPFCTSRIKRGLDDLCIQAPQLNIDDNGVMNFHTEKPGEYKFGIYPPLLKKINPERYNILKNTLDNIDSISESVVKNINAMSDLEIERHFFEMTSSIASAKDIKNKLAELDTAIDLLNSDFENRYIISNLYSDQKGVYGLYNKNLKRIILNDETFSSPEALTQGILHEITHSVDTEDYLYFNVDLASGTGRKVYQSEKEMLDQYVSAMTDDTSAARRGEDGYPGYGMATNEYFGITDSMSLSDKKTLIKQTLINGGEKVNKLGLNNADTLSAYYMSLAGLGRKSQVVDLTREIPLKDTARIFSTSAAKRPLKDDLIKNNLISNP
ncbi:hypothetical protein BG55_20140 [Erwinia mallotivora]|uniref:Uncharacterized protein n=2 Tax=Erwinia mallotivora TaxID=69222 RepID=A0A014M736_9GAMM|nr:hypothetical protein BG55_20140 [Erwinia mallotivora]